MIKKTIATFLILSLAACAKNRDVERVRAGDKENVQLKQNLLGIEGDATHGTKSGLRAVWLTKMTVVNTSDAPAGTLFVGFQGDVQAGYFDFTESHLQFRSLKGALEGQESENIKNNVLLNWDIEHFDYVLDERDGQTTNQEIQDNFKTWNQKKYFRINWTQPAEIANATQMFPSTSFSVFQCWQPVNVRRVDNSMKVEEDHIGYKIEVVYQRLPVCGNAPQWAEADFNFTVTYMYSFRKLKESDYTPKVFENEQDPDRYKYGHFQTTRKVINPSNGRHHNIFFENRWAEKTQHFYFVKGFPQRYKWIWDHNNPQSVLGQTNALLESYGSKLRFEIHDYNYNTDTGANNGPERQFGDLRYSFVNFIEEIEAGGTPLGYGPSDTNPFTGEIIAANSMVWTGMLDYYMELMKKVGAEAQTESSLFRQLRAALNLQNPEDINSMVSHWDHNEGVGHLFREMAQATRYTFPGWNSFTQEPAVQWVVPSVIERFNDGTIKKDKLESIDGNYFTSVVNNHLSRFSLSYENVKMGGSVPFKAMNPYNLTDISWLESLANSNEGSKIAGQSGMRDFIKMLKNLRQMTDQRATGGLDSISEEHFHNELAWVKANQKGHCIIDMEEFAGGFAGYLQASNLDIDDPEVRADLINTVLYRVSMHEFGHNLNLRHNFYGSLDQKNFGLEKGRIADFKGSNGLKVFGVDPEKGSYQAKDGRRQQVSSSVMDYIRLEDEVNTPWAWEDYDVAAILDSYHPKQFDDQGHLYMFCTDEHTATSALCNRHDFGTTPTQILMSQIRAYDERYLMRNFRFGRAYWGTAGYDMGILGTMLSMKEFLPLWRSGFAEDLVLGKMGELGITNPHEQSAGLEALNREMRQATKLTMAFYQAVIQQSRGDRDFRSEYDEVTGALKRIGIIADKIYAMFFLAGDDAIFYHPNRIMLHNSFLTHSREPGLAEFSDNIWRNIVTDRNIAMEPWFVNFARFQYARNATNFNNRGSASLIGAMKIIKVENAQDLKAQYDITMDVSRPAKEVVIEKSTTGTFKPGDKVVVVHIDGSYYLTNVTEGHVTFSLFQEALNKIENGDDDDSITQFNMDVLELYWLYNLAESGALQ